VAAVDGDELLGLQCRFVGAERQVREVMVSCRPTIAAGVSGDRAIRFPAHTCAARGRAQCDDVVHTPSSTGWL
jgi:hypothetical protein